MVKIYGSCSVNSGKTSVVRITIISRNIPFRKTVKLSVKTVKSLEA
jgi:hypothetical protein